MSEECRTCGGDESEFTQDPDANEPFKIITCPMCGGDKCNMCDMGDDVGCINCENEE